MRGGVPRRPSSRRLLALLPLRSLDSSSFESDLSWTAVCWDLGLGRAWGNGREEAEFDLYLASDSRRVIGGEPSGDLPRMRSALERSGGRAAGGFALK